MKSSDFCFIISRRSFSSFRRDTLGGTVFLHTTQCTAVRLDRLIDRGSDAVISPRNEADLPSSQGFLVSMPGSWTPAGPVPRSIQEHRYCLPRSKTRRPPHRGDFGALSPWPTDSLSTLNRRRRRSTVQDSLPGGDQPCPGGTFTHGKPTHSFRQLLPCDSTSPAPELCSAHSPFAFPLSLFPFRFSPFPFPLSPFPFRLSPFTAHQYTPGR